MPSKPNRIRAARRPNRDSEAVVLDNRLDIVHSALTSGDGDALSSIAVVPDGLGCPIFLVTAGTSKATVGHLAIEVACSHVQQIVQLHMMATTVATAMRTAIARATAKQ